MPSEHGPLTTTSVCNISATVVLLRGDLLVQPNLKLLYAFPLQLITDRFKVDCKRFKSFNLI